MGSFNPLESIKENIDRNMLEDSNFCDNFRKMLTNSDILEIRQELKRYEMLKQEKDIEDSKDWLFSRIYIRIKENKLI